MEKPTIISVTHDDGGHSHWAVVDTNTGVKLWSENPEECKAQGYPVEQPRQAVSGWLPIPDDKRCANCNCFIYPTNTLCAECWIHARGGNDL